MKKTIVFLVVSILLFSCQEDNNIPLENSNNAIGLEEFHILNSSGTIITKYVFDNNNRISKIVHQNYADHFDFDTAGKLITITKKDLNGNNIETPTNLVYDNNDRITSIGDRDFDYDATEDSYSTGFTQVVEDIYTDPTTGDQYQETWTYFDKHYYNSYSSMIQYCPWEEWVAVNPVTGDVYHQGSQYTDDGNCHFMRHDGDNLTQEGNTNIRCYTYDNNLNPMYSNNTNIHYVFGLLYNSYQLNRDLNPLLNKNNVIYLKQDCDGIEDQSFEFEYNDNGLPISSTISHLYGQTVEAGPFLYGKYYYTGDLIPE